MATDTTPTGTSRASSPGGALSAWDGMTRQYDYWFTVFKRTWRGGAVTVTLECTIATRESASFEGRTIAASDTQVIDRYTAVVTP